MSTEKSLLTYESVKHLLKRDYTKKGVQIPIGIDSSGTLCTVELEIQKSSSHMLLNGKASSGKSKALEFMLKGMLEMYGMNLIVSCICGKEALVTTVRKVIHKASVVPSVCLLANCDTVGELDRALHFLLEMTEVKHSEVPEIIILDDVDYIVKEDAMALHNVMSALISIGPRRNAHIIYTAQTEYLKLGSLFQNFGIRCATRVSDEASVELFGSNIASAEGGTRKYGDITYSQNGVARRIEVPFCDCHK